MDSMNSVPQNEFLNFFYLYYLAYLRSKCLLFLIGILAKRRLREKKLYIWNYKWKILQIKILKLNIKTKIKYKKCIKIITQDDVTWLPP